MKKRFIAAFLLIGMLISVLPAAAETKSFDNLIFGEDYSRKIVVTDFTFSPSSALVASGTVTASCNVKTAEGVSAAQNCTLVVMVYNGGKLFDLKTGTVAANGTAQPLTLSAPANLPSDITNVKVYAYIWTDFLSLRNGFLQPRILARPAVFGSSSNSLYELNINGTPVEIDTAFASGDTYNYVFEKYPSQLPVITVKADDLGAKVEIENITAMGETATVKVTSQTGEVKEYNINFDTKTKAKAEVANAISDDATSNPSVWSTWYKPGPITGDNNAGIYTRTKIYNGKALTDDNDLVLDRALIQVDITKFPDNTALIKDVLLTVTGRSHIDSTNNVTENAPDTVTVNAYDFSEYVWDEASVASSSLIGPSISQIIAKTPFTSFSFDVVKNATAGSFEAKTISIKDFVINAKKNGKSKATIVLFADNSSRIGFDGRDDFSFQMGGKENTTASRRPKVELIEYISE